MFVSLSICLSQRHLKTIEKLRDKKISSIYKNLSFVAITVVNKPNSISNMNEHHRYIVREHFRETGKIYDQEEQIEKEKNNNPNAISTWLYIVCMCTVL